MPVPNQSYYRVIPVEVVDKHDDLDINPDKPPQHPLYDGNQVDGLLGREDLFPRRKISCPVFSATSGGGWAGGGVGSYHRSRERTRQSAVQRLVERKLAQKEKEREKERDRSLGHGAGHRNNSKTDTTFFSSCSPTRFRDTSGSRSENGFMLGAGRAQSPNKENLDPDWWSAANGSRYRRSRSGSRLRGQSEEPIAKTYITIGPGKPTRIREHSPAKSAKLSRDENLSQSRERLANSRNTSPLRSQEFTFNYLSQQNRTSSPVRKTSRAISPVRSSELLKNTTPLKSTNIFKTFRASTTESPRVEDLKVNEKTVPFFTEKVFTINQVNNNNNNSDSKTDSSACSSRRPSVDILNNNSFSGLNNIKRASPDYSDLSTSTLSSQSSSLASSAESVISSASQRRISLEQRFQRRTSTARFTSPHLSGVASVEESEAVTAANTVDEDGWTHIKIRRLSSTKTHCEFSSSTARNSTTPPRLASSEDYRRQERPVPASRKISLPQGGSAASRRPEPAPRRRSLTTILAPESTGSIGSTVKPFGSGLYSRSDFNGRPVRKNQNQNRNVSVKASGNDSDSSCESEYISSRNDSCHKVSPFLLTETPQDGGQDRRDSFQDDDSDRSRSERSVEPPTRTPSPGSCISYDDEQRGFMTSTKLDNYTNLEDLPILPSTNASTTFESTGGQRNPLDLRRPVKPKRSDDECQHAQAAAGGGGGGTLLTRKNSGRLRNAELALASKLVRKNSGLLRKSDSDDALSVSTVSGSGIEFFRKFVQRKAGNANSSNSTAADSCKDCQNLFRREVLIDRLVADSLSTKTSFNNSSAKYDKEGTISSCESVDECLSEYTRCSKHQSDTDDSQSLSLSTRSSVSRLSSVSGSGLLFLKNYLKKKKQNRAASGSLTAASKDFANMSFFNSTPLPFPPPDDYYGPAFVQEGSGASTNDDSPSRRLSLCSTVADLLNEDFDCDDSELKNLDWEQEWDESLPEEISYDDLVSVLSESIYSEELDFGELNDLDLEGRNTVVATEGDKDQDADYDNDKDFATPEVPIPDSYEDKTPVTSHYIDDQNHSRLSFRDSITPGRCKRKSGSEMILGTSIEKLGTSSDRKFSGLSDIDGRKSSARSRYSTYRSSSFLQDIEAELELPPMTPVSDEKEEAVRAICKYIRTKSDSSYEGSSSRLSFTGNNNSKNKSFGDDAVAVRGESVQDDQWHQNSNKGRYSRNSGYGGYDAYTTNQRESRLSMASPAMSDCMPELSGVVSPATPRRPISQLFMYDIPCSSPTVQEDDFKPRFTPSRGDNQNNNLTQQISEILTLPKNEYSLNFDTKDVELLNSQNQVDIRYRSESRNNKAANRDSLLQACSPLPPSSPPINAPRPSFYRHSSTNSSDSGCPLFEDKVASLSPTPSPRTNIELLSSNRNKLANFWEKSLGASVTNLENVSPAWIPGASATRPGGFKPVRASSGSESNLVNHQEKRLAHFLDVTRRAAAGGGSTGGEHRIGAASNLRQYHRASIGSDCSDVYDRIALNSPFLTRRRDSCTERCTNFS